MDPTLKFKNWYEDELQKTNVRIPSACCLSTLGEDGYPNARFVSLKEVKDDLFIITGPQASRKGIELNSHSKAALTFWWTATERQVRIQGDATILKEEDADKYFDERNREAKLVAHVSKQSAVIERPEILDEAYKTADQQFSGKDIPRPKDWSGFYIKPVRMEFLEFKSTRFHKRTLFEKIGESWNVQFLQP